VHASNNSSSNVTQQGSNAKLPLQDAHNITNSRHAGV